MLHEDTRTAASGYPALAIPPVLTLLTAWWLVRAIAGVEVVSIIVSARVPAVLCAEENARPVLNAGSLYG